MLHLKSTGKRFTIKPTPSWEYLSMPMYSRAIRLGTSYETVSIADETGGIDLKINTSDLYATYGLKPGKRVLVKVDELAIDNYNGMYQIGLATTDGGVLDVTGIDPSAVAKTLQVTGEKSAYSPKPLPFLPLVPIKFKN